MWGHLTFYKDCVFPTAQRNKHLLRNCSRLPITVGIVHIITLLLVLFYSQKFGKLKTHSGRFGFLNQKYNCLFCDLDKQALEQQVVKQKGV